MNGASLRINETFGPTLQGEGPSTGRLAYFVRLSGCNLDCSWCDTPYTWDWTGQNGHAYDRDAETVVFPIWMVADAVKRQPAPLVVISGGEPLLQASSLVDLVRALPDHDFEIETNGTRRPPAGFGPNVRFNVSPKLAHSGVDPDKALIPDRLLSLLARPTTTLKFVVDTPADFDEIDSLVAELDCDPSRVWIMPQGTTSGGQIARAHDIVEQVIARQFNLSVRLHVLLWENTRAR